MAKVVLMSGIATLMLINPLASAQGTLPQLMQAIQKNDVQMVHQLVSNMPNLNIFWQDSLGNRKTPLMVAAENGDITITRFLLERGANANIRPETGATALILAANNGHKDIVAILLDKGSANVNTQIGLGATALMGAAKKGHRDIVEMLLKHNADTSATLLGDKASIIAAKEGNDEIANIICQAEGTACDRNELSRILRQSEDNRTFISGKLLEKSDAWVRVTDFLDNMYKFPIQPQTKVLDRNGKLIPTQSLVVGEQVTVVIRKDQVIEIMQEGIEFRLKK